MLNQLFTIEAEARNLVNNIEEALFASTNTARIERLEWLLERALSRADRRGDAIDYLLETQQA